MAMKEGRKNYCSVCVIYGKLGLASGGQMIYFSLGIYLILIFIRVDYVRGKGFEVDFV